MKRLLTLVAFFATLKASAQQVNPVPDYTFSNRMSAGRNTVTDTAAYFSIGPRYGATRGMMPPMVVDTASFSGNRRNGLLIFSVQKNKFLYWDSVRVQWSDMAGSSGSYIVAGDTASMLTPYVRQAGYGLTKSGQSFLVDTLNIATRAWRQKGDDSVRSIAVLLTGNQTIAGNKTFSNDVNFNGTPNTNSVNIRNFLTGYNHILYSKANGVNQFVYLPADTGTLLTDKTLQSFVSGTTNYIPKFTAGSTIGNSQIFDNGTNVGVGTTTPSFKLDIQNTGGASILRVKGGTSAAQGGAFYQTFAASANTMSAFGDRATIFGGTVDQIASIFTGSNIPLTFDVNAAERMRITSGGDVGIGTSSPTGTSNRFVNIYGAASNELHLTNATTGTTSTDGFTILQSGNDVYQYNYEAGFLEFGTSNASRLRIFANGRVGINTTTDAGYQLDVNGTGRFSGALRAQGTIQATNNNDNNSGDFTGMVIGSSTTGTARTASFIKNTSSPYDFTIRTQDNTATTTGSMIFQNGSTETMRITSSGNVGIGTTSPLAVTNYTGLTLSGTNGSFTSLYTGASQIARIEVNTTSDFTIKSIANVPLLFGTNNTENARFNTGGELLINTTTDAGDYKLQVSGNVYSTGSYTSGAPSGGTARPWKLGSVVATTVILDTANYVEVEINGVAYKLALVTPN